MDPSEAIPFGFWNPEENEDEARRGRGQDRFEW